MGIVANSYLAELKQRQRTHTQFKITITPEQTTEIKQRYFNLGESCLSLTHRFINPHAVKACRFIQQLIYEEKERRKEHWQKIPIDPLPE